ncbi:hypothetical protein BASA81_002588 [Batrachochytrium salamandrivorans]|nr:hypothetical protein BASA81_002588 [Batrachochytrium salamandrivorans]
MGSGLNIAGATLNVITLLFLLVATVGSWWTWGAVDAVGLFVNFATGPFVASQFYNADLIPIPCPCTDILNCAILDRPCSGNGERVFWTDLNADNACRPGSQFFTLFSGPLGYCSFPAGFNASAVAPVETTNEFAAPIGEAAPNGTQFFQPSQAPATQGLMVTATVLSFLAVILGFAQIASGAFFLSMVTWILTLAAFSLWSTFDFTVQLLAHNPSVGIPVWANAEHTGLVSLLTENNNNPVFYGGSFGVAIAAAILAFFASLLHLAALAMAGKGDKKEAANKPAAPAAATAVPAAAQPAAAEPAPAVTVVIETAAPTQEVSKV